MSGMKNDASMPESFSIILDAKGRPVEESPLRPEIIARIREAVQQNHNSGIERPVEKTITVDKLTFRVIVFHLYKMKDKQPYHLVVGRSMTHVKTTILGLAVLLGIMWVIAVIVCSIISWLFVGRTLRPVNLMTRASLQIAASGKLGRRIENFSGTKDEFGELCQALNQMLGSLESSYAAQKKFLADASHELRTPLTSIKANLDFLKRAAALPESERVQVLKDISGEVNRMAGLVNELLMLARTEGQSLPQFQQVNLSRLIHAAWSGFHYNDAVIAREIELNIPERVFILGDPEKLKQLVIILIDNAIKYSAVGGKITLKLSIRNQQAVLLITDDGPGIPEAELSMVGQRFYRASNTCGISGSGLGLAIAKSIVSMHNAEIRLFNLIPHGLGVEIEFPQNKDETSNETKE
jgi:signal transduction histidine kinase